MRKSVAFIGFGCLQESELKQRYKDGAPATRCCEVSVELAKMDSKLQATSDVAQPRRSAILYTASLSNHLVCNYCDNFKAIIKSS